MRLVYLLPVREMQHDDARLMSVAKLRFQPKADI